MGEEEEEAAGTPPQIGENVHSSGSTFLTSPFFPPPPPILRDLEFQAIILLLSAADVVDGAVVIFVATFVALVGLVESSLICSCYKDFSPV